MQGRLGLLFSRDTGPWKTTLFCQYLQYVEEEMRMIRCEQRDRSSIEGIRTRLRKLCVKGRAILSLLYHISADTTSLLMLPTW